MSSYEELRKKALQKRRRIIFDNDGSELCYDLKAATREELLRQRMNYLLGTKVDTVFCTTRSSGFGQFSHNTKIGTVFVSREGKYQNNMTGEFINLGTDYFRIISEFCRENNIEIFWQMRMNDTHDGSGAWYGDITFKSNKLKNEHPEWLMGTKESRPQCGAWSAVNYSVPEIRQLVIDFIEEVCENYSIDGISLDFFRHPVFFKSTSKGMSADKNEIGEMNGLMRDIKQLVDKKGKERNHPLLISVRVPDSVEYALAIGLDIERWLEEGLIDIIVTTSYIKLNYWEYSVKLAHKYGVRVYPSLDETRIKDIEGRKLRESVRCYRARAMNALRAGADGIYLFNYAPRDIQNYSAENMEIFNNIGYTDELNKLDKTYFVSNRGVGEIAGGALPHEDYIRIPVLNPDAPILVEGGKECVVHFPIGDDVNWAADSGIFPEITLGIRVDGPISTDSICIKLNGTDLMYKTQYGIWTEYEVNRNTVKIGLNEVKISLKSGENALRILDLKVDITYCRGQ